MYRTAILAGAAVLAFAGIAGTAAAQTLYGDSHILTVRLPDGSLEHIRYTGDHPPHVSFGDPFGTPFTPVSDAFGPGSPFAEMERISAAVDRETEAMLQQASRLDGMAFASPQQLDVDFRNMPSGAEGYSMVSTMTDGHVCSRSVEYLSQGQGKPPRVIAKTSGNCSANQMKPFHASASPRLGNSWHPWEHSNAIQASYRAHQAQQPDGNGNGLRLASAAIE